VGVVDGRRKQLRKRYKSEREARAALDAVRGDIARGTYVHPSKITLAQACEDWLASKHGLKPSTLHGHRVNLAPALAELGEVEVQKLSKRHIDDLVTALRAGGLASPTGKSRKSWSARSVNYMLGLLTAVLRDQMRQGHVVRNVAELVDRIPADPKPPETFAPSAPSGSCSYPRRPIRDRMAACTYRATARRSGGPTVERHRPERAHAANFVDAAPVW
jgi:integrase